MTPIALPASCRGSPEEVEGICFSNSPDQKGLYILCAVDPGGALYVVSAEWGQEFNAPGWTFGPQYEATGVFHLPPVSITYESACQELAARPTVDTIPVCGIDGGTATD
ncbi:MAG: hypothetical protein ACRELB_15145 [Polyangiaceae bacterium]